MKKIWTDFNDPDPTRPRISKKDIENFKLKIDEGIILYSDDIQVGSVVGYNAETNSWFGEIVSDVVTISKEVAEAREDGFINGRFFGAYLERNEIIRRMFRQGIPKELITKVTNTVEEDLKGLK